MFKNLICIMQNNCFIHDEAIDMLIHGCVCVYVCVYIYIYIYIYIWVIQ